MLRRLRRGAQQRGWTRALTSAAKCGTWQHRAPQDSCSVVPDAAVPCSKCLFRTSGSSPRAPHTPLRCFVPVHISSLRLCNKHNQILTAVELRNSECCRAQTQAATLDSRLGVRRRARIVAEDAQRSWPKV